MDDMHLAGWLCFMRFQFGTFGPSGIMPMPLFTPECVRVQLEAKGWLKTEEIPEGFSWEITHEGIKHSDLVAPEWGIDPIGVQE